MMMNSAILVMIGMYCIILVPFFIAYLFIRRINKREEREEQELLDNQLYVKCSCGFRKIYDKRVTTITECPKCGLKASEPIEP